MYPFISVDFDEDRLGTSVSIDFEICVHELEDDDGLEELDGLVPVIFTDYQVSHLRHSQAV